MKNARNIAEFVSSHLSDAEQVETMSNNLLRNANRSRVTYLQSRNSPDNLIEESVASSKPYMSRPISMRNHRNVKSQSQLRNRAMINSQNLDIDHQIESLEEKSQSEEELL